MRKPRRQLVGALLIPLTILTFSLQQLHSLSRISAAESTPPILIDAVLYDGYELNDADEAVALRNMSDAVIDLSGWFLNDGEHTDAVFPAGFLLQPREYIWVAKDGAAFYRQFGFWADSIISSWPKLANDGDELVLFDDGGQIIDAVVFGDGNIDMADWSGPAVQPYSAGGLFGKEGQILYRKREEMLNRPVYDTNSAEDWAQSPGDPVNGRRVRYPGWDFDEFQLPVNVTKQANLTIAIAPDNALKTLTALIDAAEESVAIESLTIENLAIAEALISAAGRGVSVKLLLEGSPVGGLPAQEKYICQRIERAGGECWFMIRDDEQRIQDRYRYLHAKFILVDGRQVAISSENLSPSSLPDDDKSDGTWGRRGVVLITDAAEIIDRLQAVFNRDLDPQNHNDIFRWQEFNPVFGAPPAGFNPITESGGISYTVRFPEAAVFRGQFTFELRQSPENSLRNEDGLLRLLERAGEGDTLLIQQLQERPYWGPANSNATADPNPRLEAFIAAARRGANVRMLLDSFFDDRSHPVSNFETCRIVNELARIEKLKLSCFLGNPTGLGIHNKMILANVGGRGYVHIGSVNGTELAHKGNREIALLVQADEAYELLSRMFEFDLPHEVYFPIVPTAYRGPSSHPLISEVLYDPYGSDTVEFVELVNPTSITFDIGNFSVSDAVYPSDYEDLRHLPADAQIKPGKVLVIATSGLDFWEEYGQLPDFEILDTMMSVPDLIDDPDWGDASTFFRLGNLGDEVIFRNDGDQIVDAFVYGSGALEGVEACPLLQGVNHSYERFPYWRDTDSCGLDFRDWPFPSPGLLP
jgi:phosphatidylserine/phosphatidylglycerophosphate/cardiolipin synthase-like enzyme